MRILIALILLLAVPMVLSMPVLAAEKDVKTALKKVPIRPSSISDGKQMFSQYCGACHGTDGKGVGAATPALKVPAPDLTLLAKREGGKFPEIRMMHILQQTVDIPVHGGKDMPTWGPLFRSLDRANESTTQLRAYNLMKYIESIQVK
jgi:mono/diheme cytochrome c family protein